MFPTSYVVARGVTTNVGGQWSAFARLLPYLEQGNLQSLVNWNLPYNAQLSVAATRVPTYICPSEPNDVVRVNPSTGVPRDYPANYVLNFGTWQVYNPTTSAGGDGVFYPSSRVTHSSLTDGTSNTLGFSEAKAFTPYIRNVNTNPGPIPPTLTTFATGLVGDNCCIGPTLQLNTGHTEWADGLCQQSGFTTTFQPNTIIPYTIAGRQYDIDFVSWREGTTLTQPTYAALPARSYHVGLVQCGLMDGSVRPVNSSIDLVTWRSLGTRSGGEVLGEY